MAPAGGAATVTHSAFTGAPFNVLRSDDFPGRHRGLFDGSVPIRGAPATLCVTTPGAAAASLHRTARTGIQLRQAEQRGQRGIGTRGHEHHDPGQQNLSAAWMHGAGPPETA
jgi:hypothetical protein